MKPNILEENTIIPSEHQYGDPVYLDFGSSGRVDNCKITKIAFSGSQTWYDVEVAIHHEDGGKNTLRLHNINGAFVKSIPLCGKGE